MVTYDNLWETLKRKGISQYKLIHEYGLSRGQLDRLKKNENITTNTLDVLCNILDCEINDVTKHIKDGNNKFSP